MQGIQGVWNLPNTFFYLELRDSGQAIKHLNAIEERKAWTIEDDYLVLSGRRVKVIGVQIESHLVLEFQDGLQFKFNRCAWTLRPDSFTPEANASLDTFAAEVLNERL